MEHDPLLSPGFHDISVAQLDNHFLSHFSTSETRPALIAGFRAFVEALGRGGVACEVWIDGSFSTNKLDPNDVDIVVFAAQQDLDQLDPEKQAYLEGLLLDRIGVRRKFGVDVLFSLAEDADMRSYWRGWYGYDRQERPKGIAKLVVTP